MSGAGRESPLKDRPVAELTVDFGTRPKAPKYPDATEAHRRQGRKLAAIHRAHLNDLGRIAAALQMIASGTAAPAALSQAVLASDMAQNYRAFGSLCGQECRFLSFHHDAEEYHVFPTLERQEDSGLRAVVARLRAEHEVVHELLERLQRASMALMFEPDEDGFRAASEVFTQLEAVVRSHFGYEETELEEAIGLYVDDL